MHNAIDKKGYESDEEIRAALERRLGSSLDDRAWEGLSPEWAPPYDNVDLKELVQRAANAEIRPKRRRGKCDFRAWLDVVERPSVETEVIYARGRLGIQGAGVDNSNDPRMVLAAMVLASCGFFVMELKDDPAKRDKVANILLDAWLWWQELVREVACLSLLHRIPDRQAFELIAGYDWGSTRKRRRLVEEISVVPHAIILWAISTRLEIDRAIEQKVSKHRWRPLVLNTFLKAISWKPESGPPAGNWEEARILFNRVAAGIVRDEELFDSKESFRAAVRRHKE